MKLQHGSLERSIVRKFGEKKKNKKVTNSSNKKGDITINSTDVKIIIKEYSEQVCDKKFTNLVKS